MSCSCGTRRFAYLLRIAGQFKFAKRSANLCAGDVLDPQKDIVVLGVANVIGREFARQPLVAIEIDLDLKRKPGLNTHMDQAKVAIHEIEVQVQAFAPGRLHEHPVLLEAQGESAARLEHGEDTHQPLFDAVALSQLSGCILLSNGGSKIFERALMLLSQSD